MRVGLSPSATALASRVSTDDYETDRLRMGRGKLKETRGVSSIDFVQSLDMSAKVGSDQLSHFAARELSGVWVTTGRRLKTCLFAVVRVEVRRCAPSTSRWEDVVSASGAELRAVQKNASSTVTL